VTDVLRTARLVLRPLRLSDADDIHAGLQDWEVTRRLEMPPWPYRRTDAVAFLQGPVRIGARGIDWQGRLVGVIAVDDSGELGYWLARRAWGQGIATEAGRAMVDHAFTVGRRRVLNSGHQADNAASGRVLAKLGFEVTGQEMCHYGPVGRFLPSVQLRLTADRWKALRALGE